MRRIKFNQFSFLIALCSLQVLVAQGAHSQSKSLEGLVPRLTDAGEVRWFTTGDDGKAQAFDRSQIAPLLAELGQVAQQYPCGDQALPEAMIVRHGVIELRFNIREMCDSGKGTNYVPGSAIQKRVRPAQGTPATVAPGGAATGLKPATTGFGVQPKK